MIKSKIEKKIRRDDFGVNHLGQEVQAIPCNRNFKFFSMEEVRSLNEKSKSEIDTLIINQKDTYSDRIGPGNYAC